MLPIFGRLESVCVILGTENPMHLISIGLLRICVLGELCIFGKIRAERNWIPNIFTLATQKIFIQKQQHFPKTVGNTKYWYME